MSDAVYRQEWIRGIPGLRAYLGGVGRRYAESVAAGCRGHGRSRLKLYRAAEVDRVVESLESEPVRPRPAVQITAPSGAETLEWNA